MPFTPFHMGVAVPLKFFFLRYFSFTLFGLTQIMVDIEPLVRLIRNDAVIHGISHSYVGASLVGLVTVLLGKPLCEYCLREWNQTFKIRILQLPEKISWPVAIVSVAVGALFHVWGDSVMHADMQPLAPFSEHNAMLGWLSHGELHGALFIAGAAGGVGLAVVWFWRKVWAVR